MLEWLLTDLIKRSQYQVLLLINLLKTITKTKWDSNTRFRDSKPSWDRVQLRKGYVLKIFNSGKPCQSGTHIQCVRPIGNSNTTGQHFWAKLIPNWERFAFVTYATRTNCFIFVFVRLREFPTPFSDFQTFVLSWIKLA